MEKTPMMRIGLSGTAAVSCSRRGASKRPSVWHSVVGKKAGQQGLLHSGRGGGEGKNGGGCPKMHDGLVLAMTGDMTGGVTSYKYDR